MRIVGGFTWKEFDAAAQVSSQVVCPREMLLVNVSVVSVDGLNAPEVAQVCGELQRGCTKKVRKPIEG